MKRKVLLMLGACLMFSIQIFAQSHLKEDPKNVVWVSFDEYSEGKPVNESATGNNMVISDSTLHGDGVLVDYTLDGQSGKCATFVTKNYPWEGQALFVPYESAMDPVDNAITLAAWIKPTAFKNWISVIDWGTDNNGDQDQPYALGLNEAGAIMCFLNWGNEAPEGATMSGATAGTLEAEVWQHIAVTWDGIEAVFYHNGAYVGDETPAPVALQTGFTEEIVIGAGYGGGNECFDGQIDEVRIFNRALSAPEIDTLMNQIERGTGTGINEMKNVIPISVSFDNVSKTISVKADQEINNVTLYSITGRKVKEISSLNSRYEQISTSDMIQGFYLVSVNGKYSSKVVVW